VSDFRAKKSSEPQLPDRSEFKTPLSVRKLVDARPMPAENISKLALIIRFLKPVTWIPVMWSFLCGAVASGAFGWKEVISIKFLLAMLLTGPLASGTCQMLNDYFDRDLDEINEPNRPIPGGAISLRNATILIALWSVFSVITGYLIHPLIGFYVVIGRQYHCCRLLPYHTLDSRRDRLQPLLYPLIASAIVDRCQPFHPLKHWHHDHQRLQINRG